MLNFSDATAQFRRPRRSILTLYALESENVEFKSVFTADLYKEVIAFANNGGGVIYIGVDDSGNEIGVTDVDETYTKITNGIHDAISPDVTVFCNTNFLDSKEFTGSILKQLDEAYSYLMLNNRNNAEFKGLERVVHYSYPQETLREGLLNALVHRDYAFSGSIIININESQIEFISLGGLLPGLSAEDIMNGISQPRNPKLAEVFHRLHLIESYGKGIRRIYALYKDCCRKPKIIVTPNTFQLILPNINYYSTNGTKQYSSKELTVQQ